MLSQRNLIAAAVAVIALVVLLLGSLYTVHQSQQALVLQFGNPVETIEEPGLHAKVPFIQSVEFYEKRVLDFDAPSVELVLGDQKRLVVDTFVRYRIADPLRFRRSIGSEIAFRSRLEPIIFSSLRSVLGGVSLFQVLSPDRVNLMNSLRDEANRAFVQFGVQLVDVRIKRADLPAENSAAVFRRMQTERDREAKELRAQGAEIGQRIRARADRERRVIIAEAVKTSDITRGQGDAESIRISAEAYGKNVGFFDFYRSLQAYRTALGDGATSLVMSPQNEFFRYFNAPTALGSPPGGPPAGPRPAGDQAAKIPPAPVTTPASATPPAAPAGNPALAQQPPPPAGAPSPQ